MRTMFPWTAFAYWLLLAGIASLASVALFLYAFIFGAPWSPFFWVAGLSLALLITMKLIALHTLDDKRQLDLAAMYWELLSGVFGWTWIPLAVASLVLFFKALFFGGRWSHFLVCLFASSVCKWQMATSMNAKQGAIFKRQLVERGLTKEEAREVWISEMRAQLHPRNRPRSDDTK